MTLDVLMAKFQQYETTHWMYGILFYADMSGHIRDDHEMPVFGFDTPNEAYVWLDKQMKGEDDGNTDQVSSPVT
jgi:hypothetical protein